MDLCTRLCLAASVVGVLAIPVTPALGRPGDPLGPRDFELAADQGFGDRQNSWAWAMRWWDGKLYVGTNRAWTCVEQWSLQKILGPVLFPYPPKIPHTECTEDPADLPLRGEIWRWTPDVDSWERVHRSPDDVENPDVPGKMLPRAVGFRSMAVHTDPDGTEALYVAGVSTLAMWEGRVPPPQILRSEDGETFLPIPQDPGTFMGDLPRGSFRTLVSYDGRLFVIHGDLQGAGVVLVADDPAAGNDAWRLAVPEDIPVFEMTVFNGWLYLGLFDPFDGYSVVKTRASGGPPIDLTTVVENGAFLAPNPSDDVLAMHVFDGRLWVGTGSFFVPASPTEIIRINPDDSWNLLVGTPRPTPDGWKYPLSGLGEGFGNGFTDHMWRMQGRDGQLYVGTWDSSSEWGWLPGITAQTWHLHGFDMYRTGDGWYFTPLTTNGFGDPFSFGARTFASTPHGLFLGTANPYFGLQVWRARSDAPPELAAPQRLEVEGLEVEGIGRRPLLSWRQVPGAVVYHLFRSSLRKIESYPALLRGLSHPEEYEEIAAPSDTWFLAPPVPAGQRHLYGVVAEDGQHRWSDASNLVEFPPLHPPATFPLLAFAVDRLEHRGRFASSEAVDSTRTALRLAEDLARGGDLDGAISTLSALRDIVLSGSVVLAPDDSDLEVLLDKLTRRLGLGAQGLVPLASLSPATDVGPSKE